MTPQKDAYIKALLKHVSSCHSYTPGQIQLALFLYHAEVPLDQAQNYLLTYVTKQSNNISIT